MDDPSPFVRSPKVDDEASAWVGLNDAGLTPEQEKEFSHWMENPACAAAYYRLEGTWRSLDSLSALRPAAGAAADPDLQFVSARRPAWLIPVVAAAAGFIVIVAVRLIPAHPVAPDEQIASTAVGEQRQLTLSDGSVIQLNTDTAVSVRYTSGERHIQLDRGEAHFAVAKNPARPFIVAAGDVAVRAVGTAFDVRIRHDSVEVLVTEGKVRVDETTRDVSLAGPTSSPQTILLAAGQRALIQTGVGAAPEAPDVTAPAPADIARELSWQQGRLSFGPAPLRVVVEEFNRYNKHQLVITDPQIGALRIGGTFRPGDYDAFVRILEDNFGVRATRNADETLLGKAK